MSSKYVVFTKGQRHWITRYLHPEISHCYTLTQSNGTWIVNDTSTLGCELYTIDSHSDILSNSYVIKVEQDNPKGLLMLNTCVGQVKHQLGIRKPFIFTPYQLFKYLREYHGPKTKKAS